jgi:hypothetical protein
MISSHQRHPISNSLADNLSNSLAISNSSSCLVEFEGTFVTSNPTVSILERSSTSWFVSASTSRSILERSGFPFLCHGIGNGISSCTSSLSFYNCDCLNVYWLYVENYNILRTIPILFPLYLYFVQLILSNIL